MFARDSKRKNPRIETLLAKSVRVKGDFDFSGGLHLDGHIAGNVRAPEDSGSTLSVSEHGCIEGAVVVPTVVLNGRINGDIRARERLVLGARASVQGNVTYGIIEMSLGAQIKGKLVQLTPAVTSAASAP
jgi:cytoskeletal protein CcmA (bactofilin family)